MNLPAPQVDYNPAMRTVKFAWVFGEPVVGASVPALSLTIRHDKDRKSYDAVLWREDREKHLGYSVSKFVMFGDDDGPTTVRIARQPTARYNAKAMQAFADQVFAGIEQVEEFQRFAFIQQARAAVPS